VLFWIALILMLGALAWWTFVQVRQSYRRYASRSWPAIRASVNRAGVARIAAAKGSTIHGSFFTYTFSVQGAAYEGAFVIIGAEERAASLQGSLVGTTLEIRYDPSSPAVSIVADLSDPHFQGLKASQDPEWLSHAPPLTLGAAIAKR
jgi:hypothetical protein